jgi:hypothetical protein
MIDNVNMARHVLALSSGTVAGLCGSVEYARIDAYVAGWILWLQGADQRDKKWMSWLECHDEFKAFLEG